MTVVCTVFFAFALTHRHHAAAAPPHPIYGIELSDDSGFGPDAVCTEYERQSDANWRCTGALTNSTHAPVKPAVGYVGECNHLRIDVDTWVCLGDDPAFAPTPDRRATNA